jgi:hypothetical protein
MKKRAVSVIPSSYLMIMTLVYVLVATIFLELNNARGDEGISINDADRDNKTFVLELVETPCKSPCPPTAEMCIQMCA